MTRVAAALAAAMLFPAPVSAAPRPGELAPPLTLPSATGGTVSLATYKGKPVYLNFFASWCVPCNEEAGSVARSYAKYRRRGLTIVGIDEQEDKTKALDFARKYRWPFAIALDSGDIIKQYGVYGLPVHIFIDKQGKFSTYRLGEMEPNEIDEAIKRIL